MVAPNRNLFPDPDNIEFDFGALGITDPNLSDPKSVQSKAEMFETVVIDLDGGEATPIESAKQLIIGVALAALTKSTALIKNFNGLHLFVLPGTEETLRRVEDIVKESPASSVFKTVNVSRRTIPVVRITVADAAQGQRLGGILKTIASDSLFPVDVEGNDFIFAVNPELRDEVWQSLGRSLGATITTALRVL